MTTSYRQPVDALTCGAAPLTLLLLNQTWLAAELQARGHTVFTAGCSDAGGFDVRFRRRDRLREILASLPRGCLPDRLVYYDDSSPLLIDGLDELQIPSVFYSVDTHHHHQWHPYLAAAFDLTLVAQKGYIDRFPGGRTEWFPPWAPISAEPRTQKSKAACFRGNLDARLHPERAEFFRRLGELIEIDARTGDYLEDYATSKIVVNQSVADDLNYRVFEGMMCGAMMLTPRPTTGLLDLFEDGLHLVTYARGDVDDAARLAQHYLNDDAARVQIAQAGRRRVLEAHTAGIRAQTLERLLLGLAVGDRRHAALGLALSTLLALGNELNPGMHMPPTLAARYRALLSDVARQLMEAGRLSGGDAAFNSNLLLCVAYLERFGLAERATSLAASVADLRPNDALAGGLAASLRAVGSPAATPITQILDRIRALVAEKTRGLECGACGDKMSPD